jgi:tetratricopeptide (TPR) repeat protein
MHYKGTKETVPQIAQDLGVDAVIDGAVARSGHRVRITAQLIDGRNERHLWAHSYEREITDVLFLQEEVAREIATAAKVELVTLGRPPREAPHQVNPEAYDAFLKGVTLRSIPAGGGDRKGFDGAISYFEEATNKQPDFASAYAELAITYYQFSFGGPYAPKEFMPKAEAAARRALELDNNSKSHFTLAAVLFWYHWDWTAAEKEYRQAMELPRSFPHPGWTDFLSLTGHATEALAEAQQEQERDPVLSQPSLHVATALCAAGRYDDAISELKKTLEKFPALPRAHHFLGIAYVLKGDLNQAVAPMKQAVELSKTAGMSNGNPRYISYLGYVYTLLGNQKDARKSLRDLTALSQQEYVSPYQIAVLYVGLGEKEAALNSLEKAYEAHAHELAELGSDRRLDPLRSDPRFQRLAQRVGPPPTMLANQTSQR